jgi:deoxyribonuclease-4
VIRFGVHCSLKKGLAGALEEAARLKCEALQIFTRSPRMWRMRIPGDTEAAEFRELRKELSLSPLVVHTPYLPNLATAKKELYELSVRSLTDDLKVMNKLDADFLVIHPGAYSPESTAADGLANISAAINGAFEEVPGQSLLLLENVSGGGRRLGGSFAEIAAMMGKIRDRRRIGVCLDTAHALGAGYDVSTPAGIDRMLEEFDKEIGLQYLKMLHLNDSRVPRDSRKDRHEHLGKGYVGEKGFRYLLYRIKDIAAAGILETPKDTENADKNNLAHLFKWRKEADLFTRKEQNK